MLLEAWPSGTFGIKSPDTCSHFCSVHAAVFQHARGPSVSTSGQSDTGVAVNPLFYVGEWIPAPHRTDGFKYVIPHGEMEVPEEYGNMCTDCFQGAEVCFPGLSLVKA